MSRRIVFMKKNPILNNLAQILNKFRNLDIIEYLF